MGEVNGPFLFLRGGGWRPHNGRGVVGSPVGVLATGELVSNSCVFGSGGGRGLGGCNCYNRYTPCRGNGNLAPPQNRRMARGLVGGTGGRASRAEKWQGGNATHGKARISIFRMRDKAGHRGVDHGAMALWLSGCRNDPARDRAPFLSRCSPLLPSPLHLFPYSVTSY